MKSKASTSTRQVVSVILYLVILSLIFVSNQVLFAPQRLYLTMTLNIKKMSTIMVAKTSVQMSSEPTKHAVHVVLASVPVTMAEESTLTRRLYDSVSKLHSSV